MLRLRCPAGHFKPYSVVNPASQADLSKRLFYQLRSVMKNFLLILVLLLAGSLICAYASMDEVGISDRGVRVPLNRVLLIQRGDYLGAVIFVSYEKDDRGEFIHHRSYILSREGWQEEKGGNIGFKSLTFWQKLLGSIGFHTLPSSRYKPLELKGFTLFAHPNLDSKHAVIYYGPDVDHLDPAIKLAPTPWRAIKEVDLKDARLKWYSSGSSEQKINIDDLLK
jgi:hypothetical protein